MANWEYLRIDSPEDEILQLLGRRGWELVSVYNTFRERAQIVNGDVMLPGRVVYVFKNLMNVYKRYEVDIWEEIYKTRKMLNDKIPVS